jgi:hypothetical protein
MRYFLTPGHVNVLVGSGVCLTEQHSDLTAVLAKSGS